MVHIAAAITKDNQKASNLIKKMQRDTDAKDEYIVGVASSKNIEYLKNLEEIKNESPCLLSVRNSNKDYPILPLLQDHALAFEGNIYQNIEPDILWIANKLRHEPEEGISNLIKENDGSFSIVVVTEDHILCGRDKIGTIPLYFGENNQYVAVASNKKMLWNLNLKPKPVLPGTIINLSKGRSQVTIIDELTKQKIRKCPEDKTIETLNKILTEISENLVKKIPELAVSFSGGIDSTLVAYYLKNAGAKLDLICIGINEQKEYENARLAANILDLPLVTEPQTINELEQVLPEIINIVEDPNLMKIGVAAPLYFSTKIARSMGYSHIISGNGSDELFGGYMKYLKKYSEGKDPRNDIFADVKNSWMNNFNRDAKICRDLGLKLMLPFTHPRLIKYGLSLPLEYLLPKNMNEPRKIILRKLAYSLGLPVEVSDRPKKAAQYSSGVDKAIKKIAKKYGLKPWDFLNELYKKTKRAHIEH